MSDKKSERSGLHISRRSVLIALGVGVVTGSGVLAYEQEDEFLYTYLTELLEPFDMAEEDFNAMRQDFIDSVGATKYYAALTLCRLKGAQGSGVGALGQKLEKFERRLLTHFLTSTNYFNANGGQLVYFGKQEPCLNHFADFSFPAGG